MHEVERQRVSADGCRQIVTDAIKYRTMRKREFIKAGRRLATAWTEARSIAPLSGKEVPASRADAYAIADAMAEALTEPVVGWKVGATSARMREIDGHDDVIPGRMFASTTHQGTNVTLAAARYPDARAETEFGFRLLHDIEVHEDERSREDIVPHLVLHPAVEIIGHRYHQGDRAPRPNTLATIADNGGGIGFVFGEPIVNWHGIDFQNHHISLKVDDLMEAENFLGEMRCDPVQAVVDLVNHLKSRGIGLKAGDFVSTGAATVPQPIQSGSQVVADYGTLGRIEIRFD